MINRSFTIIVICLYLSGCSPLFQFQRNTGFESWNTYVDELGGSSVTSVNSVITGDGEAKVILVKAEDPPYDSDSKEYPYAGIYFEFNQTWGSASIAENNKFSITYKLSGQISMLLFQNNIPPGEEYRIELPVTDGYSTINLGWDDFSQPDWIRNGTPLDREKITGVKFQVTTPEKMETTFILRSLIFKND